MDTRRMDEEMGGGAVSPPPAAHGIQMGPSTVYQATSTTIITAPSPPHVSTHHGFGPVVRGHLHDMHHGTHSDALSSTYRLRPEFSRGAHGFHHYHRKSTPGKRARPHMSPHMSLATRFRGAWQRFTGKLRHMDPVKLAYLRTSFVFAISVLVTWTPSSINRVYTLVYPSRNSYGLNIASAAVLPLQGVWNAVIYFSTSWNLLREEVSRRSARVRWLQKFHHRRQDEIPGIVMEDDAADRAMGVVLFPITSPARTHGGTAHGHQDGLGVGDDTESDGLEVLDSFDSGSPGLRPGERRLHAAAGIELDACSRNSPQSPCSPPRHGTLRVQRGSQLDT